MGTMPKRKLDVEYWLLVQQHTSISLQCCGRKNNRKQSQYPQIWGIFNYITFLRQNTNQALQIMLKILSSEDVCDTLEGQKQAMMQ